MTATRGTTNGNQRGSSYNRRRRREWLIENYRADVDVLMGGEGAEHEVIAATPITAARGALGGDGWQKACRCYRCGALLVMTTVTVDRIIPGKDGGTYRRNNIRPACGPCNSETGGALRSNPARSSMSSRQVAS